jgi:hypothetical protein
MKLFMFSALLVIAAVSSEAQQLFRIGWQESGVNQYGEAFRAKPVQAKEKVDFANRIDPSRNRWLEDITPAKPALSPGIKRLYAISFLTLTAMQVADAATSYGRPEANPILANGSGRFGGRALGVKAGMVGGLEVAQLFMMRKNPSHAKRMAIVNFAASAALSFVVVHNIRSPY